MALILANPRTEPSPTSEQAAHPKGARRANQRPAGAWGTRFGLASTTRRCTSPTRASRTPSGVTGAELAGT